VGRRFILDADAVSGQFSTFEYDAAEDMYLIKQGQVVDHILEANKREYNDDARRNGDGLGKKVASIPLHLYFELRKQGIIQDRKRLAKWLNDSDNRAFRTAPGTV
jgi:hypothetical protein